MDGARLQRHVVRLRDGRLVRVFDGGALDGTAILGMHGMPLSAAPFRRHLRAAQDRGVRWVTYDRPGYGGSTARPGRSVADCQEEVRAIVETLGLKRFGVWGWSAGAPHALAVAARFPQKVFGTVLLATIAPHFSRGLDWYADVGEFNAIEFRAARRGSGDLTALIEPQREELLRARPEAVRSAWATILSPADRRALSGEFSKFFFHGMREGIRPSISGWRDDDLALVRPWRVNWGSVRAPTLLLHGKDDWFVGPTHSECLARRLPNSRVRIVPGEGHLSLFSHRLPGVLDWLAERGRLSTLHG
ncbi:MAG TPA: alpha/beta hydrolase [Thermoplasmata archaeon]|nr:alpha/beta hydrolase [Thermoplasmata archaeon]